MVTDSVTGLPLNNVSVTIIGPSITNSSKITGEYKTGLAAAGTYDVSFSKAGYTTKTINNVVLQNGILTILDVELNTILPTSYHFGLCCRKPVQEIRFLMPPCYSPVLNLIIR
ncbi:MAG: carboxypeptidase regulatory-like domain-containing protein [Bacteroidetes bacterium]|nr:carboxypeptidase regulatory-like domain-containing protein [Bacteroidota bacterium]